MLGVLWSVATLGQGQYPERPVALVVPFAAGGPTDTVARVIAAPMAKTLGRPVIVENRLGAGGTAGVTSVAKAAADGHTVLIYHIGMATAPALYRALQFKPAEDFAPIGLINEVPMTLVGRRGLPAKDFAEFLAYARPNRDKLNYGHAGLGSASHLCGILLMSAVQTDFTMLAYEGTAPAMSDLLGGQVDFMCDQTTNTTSQIRAGRVIAYGVTTRRRVASLPEVRTLDEQGLKGFEVTVWHALYAPRETPQAALDRLVAALQHALRDAGVKSRFKALGTEPVAPERATPDALRAHLKAETERWTPLLKKAGIYAD